jgi:hypothetical protein
MDVYVHHHRAPNEAVGLKLANCHGSVVYRAESLAVPWVRVMETAADVETYAVAQCKPGRENAASRGKPKAAHDRIRIGYFHTPRFFGAQEAAA